MSSNGPILIVDDDPDDRDIYEEVFTALQLHNKLEFFAAPHDAFNYLMSTKEYPFIIFSDVVMPVMDGITFKRKLDEVDHIRMKSIPFVFISTYDREELVHSAYRDTSLQGYFRKPTNIGSMKALVKSIILYWQEAQTP